jgi:FkbM family methyltransferase
MLIPVRELVRNFKVSPKGVLHVGAHQAEESSEYDLHEWGNVVWVEAQPDLVQQLKYRLPPERNIIIEAAVWNESDIELEFHVASNGESSSLLELGSHAESYPNIRYDKSIKVKTKRLDEVIPRERFADFLNVDVQGVELRALQGLGERISEFKWIYTEVNNSEVYKDCTLVNDLDEFLRNKGFSRVTTRWVLGVGWGDAMYVNNEIQKIRVRSLAINLRSINWMLRQLASRVKGKLKF